MSSLIWQGILLGLWGVPTLIFIPILLRNVGHDMMANILVAQVYVSYIGLFVQFGFPWSGPAAVSKSRSSSEAFGFWRQSIRLKLRMFIIVVAIYMSAAFVLDQFFILAFCIPLFAQALNSNWFLQTKGNYWIGVLFAFVGITLGAALLPVQSFLKFNADAQACLVIIVLTLSHTTLGVGSYFATKISEPKSTGEAIVIKFSSGDIKADLFFLISQLLLLGSGSLGTLAINNLSDASVTAAYASTEKLFNLVANGLIGLFMGVYPRLARSFHLDKDAYVGNVKRILFGATICTGLVFLIIIFSGQYWLSLYLGKNLASLVNPILIPLGVWLMLCIVQHLLTAHLVLTERRSAVLGVQAGVLFTTLVVGLSAMNLNPLYWVYGMISGQLFALLVLARLYFKSEWYKSQQL